MQRQMKLLLFIACIVLSVVTSNAFQLTSEDSNEPKLIKRSDPIDKILSKALEKCTCDGFASVTPQLCLSNCLHTMTPLQQQEALQAFDFRQELAAYSACAGACIYCGHVAHDFYRQHQRRMRRERNERRREIAQGALDAQDMQAAEQQQQRHYEQELNEFSASEDEWRIDVPAESPGVWTDAPEPMGQMQYQEGTPDELIGDVENQASSSASRRRRSKGSSRRSQRMMRD